LNSVTSIGAGAFGGCGFNSLTIPNSVTSIGSAAFGGCPNLTNATIDAKIIGDNSFGSCYKLATVTFGNSVTNIDYWAFNYCTNLQSITIPRQRDRHRGLRVLSLHQPDQSNYW
jgi:hypothetical protein